MHISGEIPTERDHDATVQARRRRLPTLGVVILTLGLVVYLIFHADPDASAAVEIGLPEYDRDRIHHFRLTRAAIEDVYRTLVTEARADRIHNPGLEPGRVDTIVGGMCILARIVRYFDADDVLVSESDILDGLIMSQIA